MTVARIGRVARIARVSELDAGNTILTITDDGSLNALVTCAAPHGLVGGETVTITGTVGYNTTVSVDGVPSATTWYIGGSYTADSIGGRWHLA
jgi:hypothetical protein